VLFVLGLDACRPHVEAVAPIPPRPTPAAALPVAGDAELLRAALGERCPDGASAAGHSLCAELERLYGSDPQPRWWTLQGPTPQARELGEELRGAAGRGLDPAHYAEGARAAKPRASLGADARARRDVALSLAALRIVSDLGVGRVPPRDAGVALERDGHRHDLAATVDELASAPDVGAALTAIEPPFASYQRLRLALARYRALARDPTLAVPLPERTVRPGERLPQASALRRRLATTGDMLDAGPTSDAPVYDAELAAAVARFQLRHGIKPDGVLGPATTAALSVPLYARVEQIELALERFRWLPHRFSEPPLAVNIPEFRLYATRFEQGRYERADDELSMKVIVGEAWERQTPVFASKIRSVIFWPFWDVPPSIATQELLPRLRRDPETLAREHLELVEGYGAQSTPVPLSPENLERLAAGELRLRQPPGLHNALGQVKFVFPNPFHVFLHGTPTPGLFARERRDFSHGCIRAEDPLALALHVLRSEPDWTPERIALALAGPGTQEVRLTRPLPVYVMYLTAVARPDGTVQFFPDLYGLDARLATLLSEVGSGA
jgi:murein L,D-transpeptidase YcbB/YkuD